MSLIIFFFFFFFQAEDGIRDDLVTGVQTCALPISAARRGRSRGTRLALLLERPHRPADADPARQEARRPHAEPETDREREPRIDPGPGEKRDSEGAEEAGDRERAVGELVGQRRPERPVRL